MISLFAFRIKSYFQYLWKSKNLHGIHSPFIYKLTNECIYLKKYNPDYQTAENIRKQLFSNNQEIEITDFGAGSNINPNKKRRISDIAKNSAKNNKYGRLLFRLSRFFNFKRGIELGTSLGVSALYIATANKNMQLHTIEGCPNTAKIAGENFEKAKAGNITLHNSDFDSCLKKLLPSLQSIDLAFIDGNHRKEPTLKYFEELLPFLHNDSVIIFDDIHWSPGMQDAWDEIKSHPKVTASIDLFELGIVFFRKEQEKEEFVIRY